MIIRFPTGLFRTVLPSETGFGNITYTLSGEPPETPVRTIQLPIAEKIKPLPEATFSQEDRRPGYGELIYSISKGNRSEPGSNTKQFEVGDVLEFEEDSTVNEPVYTAAPQELEIQHNTNILDLSGTLTEEEIAQVVLEAERRQRILQEDFAKQQSELKSITTMISENQKKINEVNKAIRATRVAFGLGERDSNEILDKLLVRKEELGTEREQLILSQNEKSAEVETTSRDLIKVSQLVR